ncbi:MAG: hypothetical protein ACKOQ4_13040 [Mycobacterium sp.]
MTTPSRPAAGWALPGYALALTAAVTGPLWSPGYLLIRDAVSTPRSYLTDAAIGLGESAPRAVPQDFAIAVVSAVVDGGLLVRVLLIAGVFLAGLGAGLLAGRVVPEAGLGGRLTAATVAVWNPFVAERLLQGQWSLVLAYGCLPWVAAGMIRLRRDGTGWAALVFWIALAGLTPTGAILAAVVALVCVAVPGPAVPRARAAAGAVAAASCAAAPWLAASLLGSALNMPEGEGLASFSPRAEPLLGTLGSLAGLGGIWNAEAVPPTRTTGFALVGTLLLLAVVLCGAPAVLRARTGEPLLVLAAVAVLVPAAMSTGPGLALLRAAVETVHGLAVLRDGQKWVALAMPGYALAAAGAVLFLRRWMRPALAALMCCTALLAGLPDLAWGVAGGLRPVHYPPGWAAATGRINADPATVAVLPADIMRRFAWSGPAPVLDPAPRWVRAEVLSTGDLMVAGRMVPGEGGRARQVQALLESGADPGTLAGAGVGWLLVERGTPGEMGASERSVRQLPPAYADADIAVYRIAGVRPPGPQPHRAAVLAAHLLWAATLTAGAVGLATAALRRRAQS